MTFLFQDPRDINGSYTFTYHILDTIALYCTMVVVAGSGPDTSANVGRVLLCSIALDK